LLEMVPERKIVPSSPTATNTWLPKAIPLSDAEVGLSLGFQQLPSSELWIAPRLSTAT
jgi:hypothetical protein